MVRIKHSIQGGSNGNNNTSWPTLELRPLSTLNEISCSSHSRETRRAVDHFLTQDINKRSSLYHLWTETKGAFSQKSLLGQQLDALTSCYICLLLWHQCTKGIDLFCKKNGSTNTYQSNSGADAGADEISPTESQALFMGIGLQGLSVNPAAHPDLQRQTKNHAVPSGLKWNLHRQTSKFRGGERTCGCLRVGVEIEE